MTARNRDTLGVMWKTVSADCNIACDYCYYSTLGASVGPSRRRIDARLLDKAIREYMRHANGTVGFAWQGGEPLLAGLPFFQLVVELQAKHAPPGTLIGNAVQTNGTLLTDAWAEFFRRYNFLVGVSIDGPRFIHDTHRKTSTGKGTFDLVMRKIEHLRRHDVEFNILTVLHEDNVRHARDLMMFYAREGFAYLQFLPGMDFAAQSPDAPARYRVTPGQYGTFLCEAFDLWYDGGAPRISVRLFDDLLAVYAGHQAGSCRHQRRCSRTLVLERNGDAYPCDFYVSNAWKLGNVGSDTLDDIVERPEYRRFLALKEALPRQCSTCRHIDLCNGGCPRDRQRDGTGRPAGPDYFCEAYTRLFDYAHDRLTLLAHRLRIGRLADYASSGRPWPERNADCFCGSGRKFKRCCGPLRDAPPVSRASLR